MLPCDLSRYPTKLGCLAGGVLVDVHKACGAVHSTSIRGFCHGLRHQSLHLWVLPWFAAPISLSVGSAMFNGTSLSMCGFCHHTHTHTHTWFTAPLSPAVGSAMVHSTNLQLRLLPWFTAPVSPSVGSAMVHPGRCPRLLVGVVQNCELQANASCGLSI